MADLRPRPALLVVSGLPGTGKSALAAALAARLAAAHLSIDVVEEALLATGCPPGWKTGVAAYEAVGALARANLETGHPVVVDAVNDSDAARQTWRTAARVTGADLRFVVTICSDPVEHRRRLEARVRGFEHVGEPTWVEVLARSAADELWLDDHLVVDTLAPLDSILDEVCTVLADASRSVRASAKKATTSRTDET
jgi:predicted kinase